MAGKSEISLHQDFDAESFNFNKAFIQKERLWEGTWQGKQLSWYYNKFPFARYHGLLVHERDRQQPQYLTRSAHEFIWQLLEGCAEHFHGLGVGYNSLAAFASVNHLHFQWFLEPEGLAVMSAQWWPAGISTDLLSICRSTTSMAGNRRLARTGSPL